MNKVKMIKEERHGGKYGDQIRTQIGFGYKVVDGEPDCVFDGTVFTRTVDTNINKSWGEWIEGTIV